MSFISIVIPAQRQRISRRTDSLIQEKKHFIAPSAKEVVTPQHMTTHSGEKCFSCDQCNYSCNHAGSLKRHMRQHTGEKPFVCNQCNFSCRYSTSLKYHRLSHTGEKPFACKKCDFLGKQSRDLRNHMKKHKNEASTPGN